MQKKLHKSVYLDVNLVVNLFLKDDEAAFRSALIISLCKQRGIKVCTSVLSIAISDYLLDKELSPNQKKTAIKKLNETIEIVANLPQHVTKGLNSKRTDFEDEIHMQAAIDAGCTYLVTQDKAFFNIGQEMTIVVSTESFITFLQTA